MKNRFKAHMRLRSKSKENFMHLVNFELKDLMSE